MKMRDSVTKETVNVKLEEAKKIAKLETLNFAISCEPIYKLLEWRWVGIGVPGVGDIKVQLDKLIDMLSTTTTHISTGGLEVFWYEDNIDTVLEFKFNAVSDIAYA